MVRPRLTPKTITDGNGGSGFDMADAKKWAGIALTIASSLGIGGGWTVGQLQAAKDDAKREVAVDMQIHNLDQKVEFLVQSQREDHELLTRGEERDIALSDRINAVLQELERR